MNSLVLAIVLSAGVQQQLEGGEIADGPFHLQFNPGGKYKAVKHDKAAGPTTADGTWAVTGATVEAKVAECKGPACKEFGDGFKGDVTMVAERAMTLKVTSATAAPKSGAFYCRYQGCARRHGVLVTGKDAKPVALRYLIDFLIEKNRSRDPKTHAERALAGSSWVEPADEDKPSEQTVVWLGEPLTEAQGETSLTYCKRNEAHAKKAADLLAKDLGELSWVGRPVPKPSADASCLWDVQVVVGDGVTVPPRK
jgi:hypothetical protein